MPDLTLHPSAEALELLAEGLLPADDQDAARRHLEHCMRCAAELEGYRALFAELGALPRLAPAPGFAELVMARVRVPEPSLFELWLQRWMPSTGGGWALLLAALAAPAVALTLGVAWLVAHPQLSLPALLQWGLSWARTEVWAGLLYGAEWMAASGLTLWGRRAWEAVGAVPAPVVVSAMVVVAVAIPASAWLLYRLLRTPNEGMAHVR